MCVQAPSPCALDRTAAWLLNMNSTSSYGDAEEDRQEDSLVDKVILAGRSWFGEHGPFRLLLTSFSSSFQTIGDVSDLICFLQYQQEIALLQEKLRVAALRQDECEARLLIQDQQNQRMLQEYQVRSTWSQLTHGAS